MTLGVYANLSKPNGLEYARLVVSHLKKRGAGYFIDSALAGEVDGEAIAAEELVSKIDILIVIGGDGTVLRAIKPLAAANIPVIGVNAGTIGFLTEAEPSEIPQMVDSLLSGQYFEEERFLLKATCNGKDAYALNEIVVGRSGGGRLIRLDVFVGENKIETYAADGFIVSTPTGSTAYSLSCGGPILSPDIRAMALTPINPHTLKTRSVVVGGGEVVRIRFVDGSSAAIIADGELITEVSDEVIIQNSGLSARFIRLHPQNFYSRLLKKLDIWSMGK